MRFQFHTAVELVNPRHGINGLTKVGEVDLRKPGAFFRRSRRIKVEHFVAMLQEFLNASTAYFAASAGYNYTCHTFLLLDQLSSVCTIAL